MKSYILSFDLGTGGTKASIYDVEGKCLGNCFKEYKTYYKKERWHEQRPEDWWNAVVQSTQKLLKEVDIDPEKITCIAISGHSMAVVPIDKHGELLEEYVPIWSDTRAKKQVKNFFSKVDYDSWYKTTGNGFTRECYAIFKMMWYKKNKPKVYNNIYKVVGTKDFINYKLTGKIVTDNSYASGSGVYNLSTRTYEEKFINASGINFDILPKIKKSHDIVGNILPKISKKIGLSKDTLVMAGGVDNSCMALGTGVMNEGNVYLSLGSSAWIAISSKKPLINAEIKPFVFDHVVPKQYTSATSIFAAGSSLKWFKEKIAKSYFKEYEGIKESNDDSYDLLIDKAMHSPIGSNGIIFNPTLGGVPAAYPGQNIKGAFLGLELRHNNNDIIRAVLEGITIDLYFMYKKLEEIYSLGDKVIIVGGGSKSQKWRQLFSNIFNRSFVKINTDQNAASLGAAAIAAVGAGLWDSYDKINEIVHVTSVAKPDVKKVEEFKEIKQKYFSILDPLSEIGNIMH